MDQTIRIKAEMSCEGCCGAITKILNKVEGVSNIQCDVQGQLVTIQAAAAVESADLMNRLSVWSEASGRHVELLR